MPDSLVRIEIDGRVLTAVHPKVICGGETCGLVDMVSSQTRIDQGFVESLNATNHSEKRIFICESTSMSLRPLIPHALGFVFGEGAMLGHMAGVLRYHRIPACIDRTLWNSVRETLLATSSGVAACLHCGPAMLSSEHLETGYQAQLENYWKRLVGNRMVVPVYDVEKRIPWAAGTTLDAGIGEKALAVNALKAEGLPTANALILTNFNGDGTKLNEDSVFVSLIEEVFPLFGRTPGYALMVRGSLYSQDGSHAAWSGLIPSPSVTTVDDLATVIAAHVARWIGIRGSSRRISFSIILQERIAHPLRGILATGRPWEYSTEGLAAELTFTQNEDAGYNSLFLDDVEAVMKTGSLGEFVGQLSLKSPPGDPGKFSEAFARLVQDSLDLRDRYSIPLDIEFIFTENFHYVFVQFRPLFRLRTDSG